MTDLAGTAPSVLPAIAVALASACGFAVSTSLQHRVAAGAPESVHGITRLLGYLLTKPLWITGILAGAASLTLHALALRLGAISLVQPIMVAGVVLAVLVRAGLDRRTPSRLELEAVSITALGLAVFLVAAAPRHADAVPDQRTAITLALVGMLAALGSTSLAMRLRRANSRAFLLGTSAGILFGLTAGMLKLIVTGPDLTDVRTAGLGTAGLGTVLGSTLGSWPIWVLIGAGACGMAINQRAYQNAPLSMSMPILNIVDVLVALAFGAVVFDEVGAHDPVTLTIQVAALLCMAVGLRLVARSCERSAPPAAPAPYRATTRHRS